MKRKKRCQNEARLREREERDDAHVLIIGHPHSSERVRKVLGSVLKSDDSLGEGIVNVGIRERRHSWSSRDVGERLDGGHVGKMFLKEKEERRSVEGQNKRGGKGEYRWEDGERTSTIPMRPSLLKGFDLLKVSEETTVRSINARKGTKELKTKDSQMPTHS